MFELVIVVFQLFSVHYHYFLLMIDPATCVIDDNDSVGGSSCSAFTAVPGPDCGGKLCNGKYAILNTDTAP